MGEGRKGRGKEGEKEEKGSHESHRTPAGSHGHKRESRAPPVSNPDSSSSLFLTYFTKYPPAQLALHSSTSDSQVSSQIFYRVLAPGSQRPGFLDLPVPGRPPFFLAPGAVLALREAADHPSGHWVPGNLAKSSCCG